MESGIIVCSSYESRTANKIIDIVEQFRPGEKVTFISSHETRFNGRKIVFCHSNMDGRLALTDVNDAIYDRAIVESRKKLGKENILFIVTDVRAADSTLRRKMIEQSQPTLVSNISKLLLVDSAESKNLNQLKEFLMPAGVPIRRSIPASSRVPCDADIQRPPPNYDSTPGFVDYPNNKQSMPFILLFTLLLIICLVGSFHLTNQKYHLESLINRQTNTMNMIYNQVTELEKHQNNQIKVFEKLRIEHVTKLEKLEEHAKTEFGSIIESFNRKSNILSTLRDQMTELEKYQLIQKELLETMRIEQVTNLKRLEENVNDEAKSIKETCQYVDAMALMERQHRKQFLSLKNIEKKLDNLERQLAFNREEKRSFQIQQNDMRQSFLKTVVNEIYKFLDRLLKITQ